MALTDRVQAILLRPKEEWRVIDAEPTTTSDLYRSYIAPLAAIGPAAGWIGSTVFGHGSLIGGLVAAIIGWAISLLFFYLYALLIDALAPTFGGTRDRLQALKVAGYAGTASFVAGIFALIPALAFLQILGIYSLYLLYLGLPVLMKTPAERALAYTATIVVILIVVIGVFFAFIAAALFSAFSF